jgi:hypothetical protein
MMAGSNMKIGNKVMLIGGVALVLYINSLFGFLDLGSSRWNEKLLNDKSGFEKEWRVIALRETSNFFGNNQDYYLHGFGWGVFVEAYQQYINPTAEMDMHNTYLQFLFEVGVFPFIYFLLIFVLPTVVIFLRSFRSQLIYIPFIVLPYFENNLNTGQFVFFPFMFTLFFIGRHRSSHV